MVFFSYMNTNNNKKKMHYYSVKSQMDLGGIKVDLHEQVKDNW